MTNDTLSALRVHPTTETNILREALSTLKCAAPPMESWRQGTKDSDNPANLMQVLRAPSQDTNHREIILQRARLRGAMNTLGFGGAECDDNLDPGVTLDTIAHILNTQTTIRREQVSDHTPSDGTNLTQMFSDPTPSAQPIIQERMGISTKGIPLQSVEACLTLLGVDYTIEEDRYALIQVPASIIVVLQCIEYQHDQQPHGPAAENRPTAGTPTLGDGFQLGIHSL